MEPSKFDIADYLDSNEMIAEYLNAVLAEGNDADVITAIGHIAKSIGMSKIAQETGLSRPSLYKALSDGAKPQFETIMKVLRAIGGQIQINPESLRKNAPQQQNTRKSDLVASLIGKQ
jgi:probable addiction module antidote protein